MFRYPVRMRRALLFALLALPAMADDREIFYGTWGTDQQCARAPMIPDGTIRHEPYVIDRDWLQHRQVWCRLDWFPIQSRQDGAFTGARAQCGEDSVRDYTLRMDLAGDALTVRWNPFWAKGPLRRCGE
ncbi:MAG: hypothetical protein AAF557_19465 [Pseudomonadota bacterium]